MKKLHLLLLFVGLCVLSGCSKSTPETPTDDDNQSTVPENPRQEFPDNFLGTGDSANDILSNNSFDRLVVEIAFVNGFRPTQSAMNNFEAFLREFTFKEDIEIVFTALESPGDQELTLQEIADLEIENRSTYNDGRSLGVYIYFADAPSEGDDVDGGLVTLGAVYRNTSMIIFESTIRTLAGRAGIPTSDLETATLNHEFGHLFGLVNLGTPMVNDHEDPNAASHCTIEGCLMRAELQFTAAKGKHIAFEQKPIEHLHNSCQLSGIDFIKRIKQRTSKGLPAVPVLGVECLRDIEANGARVTSNVSKF